MASARTILVMLFGPPVLLLLWAHFIRDSWPGSDWPVLILAGLVGFVGVATSPWNLKTKIGLGVAYTAVAVAALPYLGLLAVCSTGDCL